MRGRGLIIGATGVGVVGVALLALESARALRGTVLGTSGTGVLFFGLGLVVVAAVLTVVSLGAAASLEQTTVQLPDAAPAQPEPAHPEAAVIDLTAATAAATTASPIVSPASTPATPATRDAVATLRGRSGTSRVGAQGASSELTVDQPSSPALEPSADDQVAAEAAAAWTLLCRAEVAGRVESGSLKASVRRGAALAAYREGVLLRIGTVTRHQSWAQITTITASLGGNEATITVRFTNGDGLADATFTGKNGDLAPVATALVSAAPAGVVAVSYG